MAQIHQQFLILYTKRYSQRYAHLQHYHKRISLISQFNEISNEFDDDTQSSD